MKASATRRATLLALALSGSLAATSMAAIVLNPVTAGTGVSVTGTGASPNGPVELFIDGVSQGSVVADGSGNFSFTANVAAGQSLEARVAQVWNFTDGPEEWRNGGPTENPDLFEHDPVNGVIRLTEVNGDGNMTFVIGEGATPGAAGVVDPSATRVIETRYRVTSSTWNGGGVQAIWYSVGPTFPNDIRDMGSNTMFYSQFNNTWQTTIMDASVGVFGSDNGWVTATPNQLIFGANGFAVGDTWELDYVRLAECFEWEFTRPGDTYNWSQGANAVLTFPGDNAQLASAADDVTPFMNYTYQNIDAVHQRVLKTRVQLDAQTQQGQLEFFYWLDSSGYSDNDLGQYPWTNTGGLIVKETDLATATSNVPDTDWGQNPTTLNNFGGTYSPAFFNGPAGATALVDYIRLCPLNAFGPSNTVVATGGASVSDWSLME